jgi:hypothetical protein
MDQNPYESPTYTVEKRQRHSRPNLNLLVALASLTIGVTAFAFAVFVTAIGSMIWREVSGFFDY